MTRRRLSCGSGRHCCRCDLINCAAARSARMRASRDEGEKDGVKANGRAVEPTRDGKRAELLPAPLTPPPPLAGPCSGGAPRWREGHRRDEEDSRTLDALGGGRDQDARAAGDGAVEDLDGVAVLDLVPPQGAVLVHDVLLVHEEVAAAAVVHGEVQPLHLLAQVADHVHSAHLQRHRPRAEHHLHRDPLLVPGPDPVAAARRRRRRRIRGGRLAHDDAQLHHTVRRRVVVRQRPAVVHLRLADEKCRPRRGQRALRAVLEEFLDARHGVGRADVERDGVADRGGRDGDADDVGRGVGGGGGGGGGGRVVVVGEEEEDAGSLEDAVVRGVARVVVELPAAEEEALGGRRDALARAHRLLHLPHRREVPHLEGELPAPRRRERHHRGAFRRSWRLVSWRSPRGGGGARAAAMRERVGGVLTAAPERGSEGWGGGELCARTRSRRRRWARAHERNGRDGRGARRSSGAPGVAAWRLRGRVKSGVTGADAPAPRQSIAAGTRSHLSTRQLPPARCPARTHGMHGGSTTVTAATDSDAATD
uniref:Uncharacterized protein n=1 Tax=Setaria viridis TaxID=4556 RepID=A0A4U6V811_SETVI|nr:hypothetical protein SEVIR_4G272700v2 [Setaria viridis]